MVVAVEISVESRGKRRAEDCVERVVRRVVLVVLMVFTFVRRVVWALERAVMAFDSAWSRHFVKSSVHH